MPTRKQYVAYLRSLEGGYGPARGLANNDNPYNTWYYGRRVAGDNYAWCFVTICYAQNHFGILLENGGKQAYVPNAKERAQKAGAKVVTHPGSTSGMKPGDQVCFDFNRSGEPEHTGTFVSKISSTEFYSVEGNTSTSQYSDALALKRRSVHDVLWHIELLGVDDVAGSSEEDDVPKSVQLGIKSPVKVNPTTPDDTNTVWNTVEFEVELKDAGKQHADGKYPSVLTGPKEFALNCDFHFTGIPKGTEMQVRGEKVDADSNKHVGDFGMREPEGTQGDTYCVLAVPAMVVGKGHKVRVQYAVFGDQQALADAELKACDLYIHYWG
jgi:hypothetical protein